MRALQTKAILQAKAWDVADYERRRDHDRWLGDPQSGLSAQGRVP
jgi:hypothetical protein